MPEGGVVTDRANDAREGRVADYLYYQEQDPPRSPAWVDQQACVGEAAFGTAGALRRYLYPTNDDASVAAARVERAQDLGDPELERVAAMTEDVGRDLGSGMYGSLREAIAVPLGLCTVSELDPEYIDTTVQTAIDTQLQMLDQLGSEPWLGPDGTRADSVPVPAQPDAPQPSEGYESAAQCEQEIADALEAWASGEFDQEPLLEPFTPEGRAVVIDLMNFVAESGLGPNEAAQAMGNAAYGGLCVN